MWRAGGIDCLLQCMKDYPKAVVLQENCCGALWNLCTQGMDPSSHLPSYPPQCLTAVATPSRLAAEHKAILGSKGAIELILAAMEQHIGRAALQKNACAALWDLTFLKRAPAGVRPASLPTHVPGSRVVCPQRVWQARTSCASQRGVASHVCLRRCANTRQTVKCSRRPWACCST